jgi:hypothetical protein
MKQARVNELFKYDDGKLIWKKLSSKYSNKLIGKEFGCRNKDGYLEGIIDNHHISVHRVVFLMFNGFLPDFIDHIDGNIMNNKIENLRKCNLSQNNWNAKKRKDNKSGVKGVFWNKAAAKWSASIQVNKKRVFIGYFSELTNAKNAIELAREDLHNEFSNNG